MKKRTPILAMMVMFAMSAWPGSVDAQRRLVRSAGSSGNPFTLETYAGGYQDAHDLSERQTGYVLGLRLGYRLAPRARLLGNLTYARADDVAYAVAPDVATYDNIWVMTTGGFEYDVIPGNTAVALGIEGGVAWRRVDLSAGTPATGDDLSSDGFASYDVFVPRLTVRHQLGARTALALSFQDFMIDVLEGPTDHSLALTLGLVFR